VVVLDTGALVYWSLDPERLSVPAAAAIAAVEQKVVSSISIWEIGQKIKRGELSLPLRLSDYVDRLGQVEGLEIAPVDEKCWMRSLMLDWDNGDTADRAIVATAMLRACDLISSDAQMQAFYSRVVW
jgi:PIN domain nuclease of toxin-antitoxin system